MATASPVLFIVLVAISSVIVGAMLASIFFLLSGAGGGGGKASRRLPAPPKTAAPAEEQELLRVSRTKKGSLTISVQGRPFHRIQEIPDPQMGIETTEAVKAVLDFAQGLLPTATSTAPQPVPSKSTADEAAFLEQLRQAELFSTGKPTGLPPRPSRAVPLRTPAEEINDLIQQRLERWPDLLKEKVRLTTHEDGGLRIHVGLYTYKSMDDIPDPKARALIKDAIREWESSRHPG